jgi:hypothetical protein
MYGMSVTNTVSKMKIWFTESFLYSETPEMSMDYNSSYQYANDGDDVDSRRIIIIFIKMESFN